MKITTLIAIILLSFSLCNAQNKKHKPALQKSEESTKKLNENVKLSDAQFEKIKIINTKYYKGKEVLDAKIKVLEDAKKQLKKERKNNINAILTEEQKEKRKQIKKKKK